MPSGTPFTALDEALVESFPASDPPQMTTPHAADAAPAAAASPGDTAPSTIGNQGTTPSTRIAEETFDFGADGALTVRFDAGFSRVQVQIPAALTLDAEGLDRLIAGLSAKRVQMG